MKNKSFFLVTLLLLLAVSISGCSPGEDKAKPAEKAQPRAQGRPYAGDPAAGKDIYRKYCHFCHGPKGMGDGPIGIAITPRPADLITDTARMSKPDKELFRSISEGIRKEKGGKAMQMPSWKEILTEKERWDVLSYIRLLEKEHKEEKN